MTSYSENLYRRVSTRGAEHGYCAICKKFGKLSKDHVPPKGCDNIRDKQLKTILAHLSPAQKTPVAHSQNGSHFRTICEECNNTLLGTKYDPEVIKWRNEVIQHTSTESYKFFSEHVIKPQKIARCVIGHLLAANAVPQIQDPNNNAPAYSSMRNYFLNENEPLPENLKIYYWIYPYRPIVVVRALSKCVLGSGKQIAGDLLKFPPFGFFVEWHNSNNAAFNLPTLISNRKGDIDSTEKITLDYRKILPWNFPETPARDEVILLDAQYSSVAIDNPKK